MLVTVSEMHRFRVTPNDLDALCAALAQEGADALSGKLHDVSLARRAYDAYMYKTLDFPGDLLDKLYETLCSFRFFAGKRVFFDSFYGFTAQELAIIGKILSTAEETCITFLCDSEKTENECFMRGKNAAFACRKLAEKAGIPIKDIFLSENKKHTPHSALAHLAQHFSLSALSEPTPETPYDGVKLVACADIYAEAEFAVRTVSDLLTKGVLPREILLCARSVADYDGILDAAFENAGIPYVFDKPVDLSSTPTAALVFSAFDSYFTLSLDAVSAYLKTGLSGLDDAAADRLDLYLHTWNIHGKAYFHEEWHMDPAGMRGGAPDSELLAALSISHDGLLSCLDAFSASLDSSQTAADMAHAVYELTVNIARLSGKERFDDRADGEYLDLLNRALDTVTLTIGNERVTPRRFYDLLRAVISNMTVGKIPELLDQVRFSPVTLMRTDGVKYSALTRHKRRYFSGKARIWRRFPRRGTQTFTRSMAWSLRNLRATRRSTSCFWLIPRFARPRTARMCCIAPAHSKKRKCIPPFWYPCLKKCSVLLPKPIRQKMPPTRLKTPSATKPCLNIS